MQYLAWPCLFNVQTFKCVFFFSLAYFGLNVLKLAIAAIYKRFKAKYEIIYISILYEKHIKYAKIEMKYIDYFQANQIKVHNKYYVFLKELIYCHAF